jgi:hypothetical protein
MAKAKRIPFEGLPAHLVPPAQAAVDATADVLRALIGRQWSAAAYYCDRAEEAARELGQTLRKGV